MNSDECLPGNQPDVGQAKPASHDFSRFELICLYTFMEVRNILRKIHHVNSASTVLVNVERTNWFSITETGICMCG